MLEVLVAIALAILLGNVFAHKTRITPAVALIIVGCLIALIPVHAMHEVREMGLPPQVILEIFLPVMLFWETRNTSWREVRTRMRGVILTGTLLVIITAFAIAAVLHIWFGVYLWYIALLIGVALAPTDAVAVATLNGKLPKSGITTLKGEALINDGTTLVLLAIALQVAGGNNLSFGTASSMFFFSFAIGIVVGLAVGWVGNWVRSHLENPMFFSTFMFTVPFVAFLLAEEIAIIPGQPGSGVVAVVVAAFYLTVRAPETVAPANRFYGLPIWAFVTFIMNGALFVLVGVQLPTALEHMSHGVIDRYSYNWGAALVLIVVAWLVSILVRFIFLEVSVHIIRLLDRSEKQRALRTSFKGRVVSTMAGLRGGVSLAVALSIPADMEGRDLTVFVVSGVVLLSMIVQGALLPLVIKWAKIPADDSEQEEVDNAVRAMLTESFDAIGELGEKVGASEESIERIREEYMFRISMYRNMATARKYGEDAPEMVQVIAQSWDAEKELQAELINHQREVLKRLQREGKVDMDAVHIIQERLDVEEIRLLGPVELE